MCVLAVQAFLEAIDPGMSAWAKKDGGKHGHSLPVEPPGIRDAAAMGKLGEVDGVGESF
jgi:hypothetical protein